MCLTCLGLRGRKVKILPLYFGWNPMFYPQETWTRKKKKKRQCFFLTAKRQIQNITFNFLIWKYVSFWTLQTVCISTHLSPALADLFSELCFVEMMWKCPRALLGQELPQLWREGIKQANLWQFDISDNRGQSFKSQSPWDEWVSTGECGKSWYR